MRSWRFSDAAISVSEDEVRIENNLPDTKKKDVRWLLEAFLALNDDLAKYSVIEFSDIFTVGMRQAVEKLVRHACESCGCVTQTELDLIVHRRTHAGHI